MLPKMLLAFQHLGSSIKGKKSAASLEMCRSEQTVVSCLLYLTWRNKNNKGYLLYKLVHDKKYIQLSYKPFFFSSFIMTLTTDHFNLIAFIWWILIIPINSQFFQQQDLLSGVPFKGSINTIIQQLMDHCALSCFTAFCLPTLFVWTYHVIVL